MAQIDYSPGRSESSKASSVMLDIIERMNGRQMESVSVGGSRMTQSVSKSANLNKANQWEYSALHKKSKKYTAQEGA